MLQYSTSDIRTAPYEPFIPRHIRDIISKAALATSIQSITFLSGIVSCPQLAAGFIFENRVHAITSVTDWLPRLYAQNDRIIINMRLPKS